MTHTIEVSRIARTIARGLRLNEDLTEAAAYGHDLGHTPFGHAGERVLHEIMPGGFAHNEQSLRVVDRLEKDGEGLNLTWEVRRGILCHTGSDRAETLEGQLLRLADKIAYINHDIDDAIRGKIIYPMDIPLSVSQMLGFTHSERINTLVTDIIASSAGRNEIVQSAACRDAMHELREFMFEYVYRNPVAKGEEGKAQDMLRRHREGRSTQLAALAGELSPEEMNHLVSVMDQPESLAHSQQALRDYIEIIETEALKRSGTDQVDPLLAAREKFREKKGYGG